METHPPSDGLSAVSMSFAASSVGLEFPYSEEVQRRVPGLTGTPAGSDGIEESHSVTPSVNKMTQKIINHEN